MGGRVNTAKIREAYNILSAPMAKNAKLVYHILALNGEMNVQEIEKLTFPKNYLPQSCVSNALRRLYEAGYLYVREEGRFRYYSINEEQVDKVNRIAKLLNTNPDEYYQFNGARKFKRLRRVNRVQS